MSTHLWNRLLLGFHPGQLSFILRASCDTLPTLVNLRHWKIQTSSNFQHNCIRRTSAHILNGCPVALQQGRHTYWHDQVLLSLFLDIQKHCSEDTNIFADLDNYRAYNTHYPTINLDHLISTWHRNLQCSTTWHSFPRTYLSTEHFQAAWEWKSSKIEYQLLISELDRSYSAVYSRVGQYFIANITWSSTCNTIIACI